MSRIPLLAFVFLSLSTFVLQAQTLDVQVVGSPNDGIVIYSMDTANTGLPVEGFVLSVCHDPSQLNIVDLRPGPSLEDFSPDFINIEIFPTGFVFSVTPPQPDFPFPNPLPGFRGLPTFLPGQYEVAVGVYDVVDPTPGVQPIHFCDSGISELPVLNTIVILQDSFHNISITSENGLQLVDDGIDFLPGTGLAWNAFAMNVNVPNNTDGPVDTFTIKLGGNVSRGAARASMSNAADQPGSSWADSGTTVVYDAVTDTTVVTYSDPGNPVANGEYIHFGFTESAGITVKDQRWSNSDKTRKSFGNEALVPTTEATYTPPSPSDPGKVSVVIHDVEVGGVGHPVISSISLKVSPEPIPLERLFLSDPLVPDSSIFRVVEAELLPGRPHEFAFEVPLDHVLVVEVRNRWTLNTNTSTQLLAFDPYEIVIDGTTSEPEFIRGDSDTNGQLELNDPITTLEYLFLGKALPTCLDACDTNDSGDVDSLDCINSLQALFLGTFRVPVPIEFCGPDPTLDDTRCELYPPETCDR